MKHLFCCRSSIWLVRGFLIFPQSNFAEISVLFKFEVVRALGHVYVTVTVMYTVLLQLHAILLPHWGDKVRDHRSLHTTDKA